VRSFKAAEPLRGLNGGKKKIPCAGAQHHRARGEVAIKREGDAKSGATFWK